MRDPVGTGPAGSNLTHALHLWGPEVPGPASLERVRLELALGVLSGEATGCRGRRGLSGEENVITET